MTKKREEKEKRKIPASRPPEHRPTGTLQYDNHTILSDSYNNYLLIFALSVGENYDSWQP